MVGSEGALGVGFACKHGEADIVVGAFLYELLCYRLQGLYSVGFEVLGEHGGGDVNSQHDVDAFNICVIPRMFALRTCKHTNDERKQEQSQRKGHMEQIDPEALWHTGIFGGVRHL